ncbi:AI-2E family transporter [Allosphingosinicella sp.]|uniref:AI-2E family transporter n=1 Tax=Allosphingosinicella sp. TaxID=2823234 RepID=UPI003D707175
MSVEERRTDAIVPAEPAASEAGRDRGRDGGHRRFIERLLIALSIIVVALLLWRLRGLLILLFGAVLVAVVLGTIARPIADRLRLPHILALLIALALVLALFGTAVWLFGTEVIGQASALREAIPAAWQDLQDRLEPLGLAEPLRQWVQSLGSSDGVLSRVGGIVVSIGGGLADLLLVLVGGVYLAAQPKLYRTGVIKLVPERGRPLAAQTFDDSGRALRLWLLGRLVSMTLVGILTWIGLWLIGVPAALALGLLSAILEFVPFLGPIIASVPAILLALALSPEAALWTAGLYLLVQQIEGNLIEPMVQQRAVSLPPALLIFALVSGGLLFGMAGILLAAPLTVVAFVMVKRLYVREALGTHTKLPTEEHGD